MDQSVLAATLGVTKTRFAPLSRRGIVGSLVAAFVATPSLALAKTPHSKGRHKSGPLIMKTWSPAVQLWTVNDQLKTDIPGTLNHLKSIGYEGVETAGLMGLSASQYRRMIEDAGLTCRSAHAAMADLMDGLDQRIEDAKQLGAKWLVCSSPKPPVPLPEGKDWLSAMRDAMTLDAWKANATALAEMAPKVAKAGLKLAYHNHFMEFIDHGGVTGYSLIAGSSDALRLEVDLGWVKVGGADPLSVIEQYAGRVDLLHVKDMVVDASQPIGFRSVEVGKGLIDWKPVLEAAKRQGAAYAIVEQEPPYIRDVFESLAISRDYLETL